MDVKKPLYGLDDALRKFWLKVKEMLVDLGIEILHGHEAFYYLRENGELKGAVITPVDDFSLAGNEKFLEKKISGVSSVMTVSKV